ncbi:hypothetical protein CYMTET_28340 [Cymbomonas tetramitiformis]|uniref:Uncharacterized protein n=1 Tax=Cymbomonas tetramitiformis TaxID=36881 RepID=A0AAE0FN55_9CHLO|nr:hypothetical protein CYMTET_28340 [Cymbomonas tetramitiformis]
MPHLVLRDDSSPPPQPVAPIETSAQQDVQDESSEPASEPAPTLMLTDNAHTADSVTSHDSQLVFPQVGSSVEAKDKDGTTHTVKICTPIGKLGKPLLSGYWKYTAYFEPALPLSGKNCVCVCTENTQKVFCMSLLKHTPEHSSTGNLGKHHKLSHPATNLSVQLASSKSDSAKEVHASKAQTAVEGAFAKMGVIPGERESASKVSEERRKFWTRNFVIMSAVDLLPDHIRVGAGFQFYIVGFNARWAQLSNPRLRRSTVS